MSTWGTYSGIVLGTIYGTWLLPIYGTCAGGIYGGAWTIFSALFGSNLQWWFIPGIPSLIASTTAAYASKRFAHHYLDGYFVFEKPKHREYVS
jgi:hypothetical protein